MKISQCFGELFGKNGTMYVSRVRREDLFLYHSMFFESTLFLALQVYP